MSEREAFDHILETLHEAALDHARWSNASLLIDEALGTHGNSLLFADGDTDEDIRVFFSWTLYRGQPHPELVRWYYENFYPIDERAPRVRMAPDSQLLHMTDVYTEEELKTSAAYNALRTRGHGGDGINVRLDGPDGSRITWLIHDPVDGNGWWSGQLDTIRRLLPHVRQAVRVQQTLAGTGALGATVTELLDATGLGIIQLDARGHIVHANDGGRDLLRTGHALFDKDGSLLARASRDNDDLQRLLSRALPPFGAQGAGGSMILKRARGLPPLTLHVHPVTRQETHFAVWPIAALVLVVDPTRTTTVDPAVAGAALGLTPMESKVAVLMANGASVPRIAARMDRKVSTIRSHVKSIYAKLGLTRQVELVRLVQSLGGVRHPRRSSA